MVCQITSPEAIRTDYLEACSILDKSPRAAATLARRCLQGMIRDFWGVHDRSLAKEMERIQDKIPADLHEALKNLRELGNIGAHMETDVNLIVDIDPGEAQKLIKLLEVLSKTGTSHGMTAKKLYNDILAINQDKQEQRHRS